jgi:hypothetical protein
MKYITFATQEEFNTWLSEMNAIKGYNDGKGTATYTSTIEGTDGLLYAAIRERDIALLDNMQSPYKELVSEEVKNAACGPRLVEANRLYSGLPGRLCHPGAPTRSEQYPDCN